MPPSLVTALLLSAAVVSGCYLLGYDAHDERDAASESSRDGAVATDLSAVDLGEAAIDAALDAELARPADGPLDASSPPPEPPEPPEQREPREPSGQRGQQGRRPDGEGSPRPRGLVCTDRPSCELTCPSGREDCIALCDGVDACRLACAAETSCALGCVDTGDCNVECSAGSRCDVVCSERSRCRVRCERGASCQVRCNGADCRRVDCEDGAECLVQCASSDCGYDSCARPRTCGGGLIACNRRCPSQPRRR